MSIGPRPVLDIAGNRRMRKWNRKELIARLVWEMLGAPVFFIVPRQAWILRRLILRLFGANIGKNVHIHPSVKISIPWNLSIEEGAAVGDAAILYSLGLIKIGRYATVSQHAHICAGTHDYRKLEFPLVKTQVTIGEGVWICADAFVGPDVNVGRLAIVGARAVVTKDIVENSIVVGNPAEVVGHRPVLK